LICDGERLACTTPTHIRECIDDHTLISVAHACTHSAGGFYACRQRPRLFTAQIDTTPIRHVWSSLARHIIRAIGEPQFGERQTVGGVAVSVHEVGDGLDCLAGGPRPLQGDPDQRPVIDESAWLVRVLWKPRPTTPHTSSSETMRQSPPTHPSTQFAASYVFCLVACAVAVPSQTVQKKGGKTQLSEGARTWGTGACANAKTTNQMMT
jgi:hypothetical protein